jgi:hypothetical protein
MREDLDLSVYDEMWTSEKEEWFLLRVRSGQTPAYAMLHWPTRSRARFEDDAMHDKVIEQMFRAGVRVLDDLPQGWNDEP